MPAAPAAPPPPKTVAAPAAKPAVQAKAPPAPPAEPSAPPVDLYADDFKELRALAEGKPVETPAKAQEKPSTEAVKPAEAKKPDAPAIIDPATVAKPDEKPAEGSTSPDSQFQTAKQVREWGNSLHKENQRLKQEMEAAKGKKVDDTELKTYKERLEAIEKRKGELENALKFKDYQQTDEYKEKYFQPIVDALATAHAEISELTIEDDAGNQRKATREDFDPLVTMPLMQAAALAKTLFGDLAPEVMAHRRRYIELNHKSVQALEEYKKHGAEREQQSASQRQAAMKAARETFDSSTKDAVDSFPQFFGQIEGDDEANEALTKGLALADMAFKGDASFSPEDRAKLHSDIRLRAAGFTRQVLLNKRKDAQIEELKEKLAAFEASEPAGGDSGRPAADHEETVGEELRRLAR